MTAENPRYLSFLVLSENEKTRVPLDRTINNYEDRFHCLSKRDRALANAVIFGVLRYRGKLDWIISKFSNRKISSLDPEILYLIRIGLFQIVFLDKIPVSAAVNTTVEMAKNVSNRWTAGFVNAVLRKAGKGYLNLILPDIKKDPAFFISVEKSIPLWLSRRWLKRFKLNKTLKLCDAVNEIPLITVRSNTIKISREKLAGELENQAEKVRFTKYAEDGISFSKPACAVHEIKTFKKGYFQVQDEAAQIVSSILDPKPGEKILDACAGLGGKTGHIAQLMKNKGSVTAVDIDKGKLFSLEKEMERLGVSIVSTIQMDILKLCPFAPDGTEDVSNGVEENIKFTSCRKPLDPLFKGGFDRVLLDAPCTGLGVLRRNPDSKWTRFFQDVKRLAEKQKAMLIKAADFVKLGGVLLYSVCSCEPEENEEVVDFFLEKKPDFSINLDNARIYDQFNKTMISRKRFFKTYPDNFEMDGFFAVSMKRINKI